MNHRRLLAIHFDKSFDVFWWIIEIQLINLGTLINLENKIYESCSSFTSRGSCLATIFCATQQAERLLSVSEVILLLLLLSIANGNVWKSELLELLDAPWKFWSDALQRTTYISFFSSCFGCKNFRCNTRRKEEFFFQKKVLISK